MTTTSPSEAAPEPPRGTTDAPRSDRSASAPSWLPLESGERVRWEGGPRVQTVLPWIALALVGAALLLAAIAAGPVPVFAVVGIPLVAVPALWQYARVSRTAFVVTNTAAATRRGVVGRTVRTVSLERIQNTTVEQDPIGRVVGYGTVTIETAGGPAIEFWNVDEPERIAKRLEAERERLSDTAISGRREQWEAVLADLRAWRRALEENR